MKTNDTIRNTPIGRAILFCSISVFSCPKCFAADGALDGHRDSVIYIESTFKNAATGDILIESSSGFVVSSLGYVIGSKHAVEKEGYTASVRGAVGSREAALEKLEVDRVSATTDVALLRFKNTLSTRKPLGVETASQAKVGDLVYFSGFYGSEEWVLVDGTINSQGGIGGTWLTNLKIGKGSSGGPVMTRDGQVVAIVWGEVIDSDSGAVRIIPARYFLDLLAVADPPKTPPSPAPFNPPMIWLAGPTLPASGAGRYTSDLRLAEGQNALFNDDISSLSVSSSGDNLVFEVESAQPTISFLVIRFLIDQGNQVPLEKQYGFQSGSLARCVSTRTLGTFGWSTCNSIATNSNVVSSPGDKWKVTWTIPKSEVGLTGKAKISLCHIEQIIMPFRTIIF